MLSQNFYWGTIRKSIIAFGNMFNNIQINRRNSSGDVIQTIKIPLAYASRQKFIAKIQAQPGSATQSFETYLPRMSFEVTGMTYDPNRRVSLVQQNRAVNNTNTTLNAQYAPTPYNIDVNLYIYTKNQDDGLQIVEQILPYFNPDYNLSLNAIPALGIKNDLPIILNGLTYDDDYEGAFTQRRAIIWTLNFTMKLNFFGPINKQGIIRSATVTTFNNADLSNTITTYNVVVDPNTAIPGDDIDFVETFEDFE
jgi:hypothetical protein